MSVIAPHDLNAERAVLGLVLLDPHAVEPVCARLTPEDFYLEGHRVVFQAVQRLHDAGHEVNGLTVHAALRDAGDFELAGGEPGLALLMEQGCLGYQLDGALRIVLQQSGKRQQIQVLARALEHAQNGAAAAELAQETADALARIAERTDGEGRGAKIGTAISLGALMDETVLELRFGVPDLIPTPIPYLNERFGGGFRRGEYVVLGGLPGVAKTAWALEWARYAAQQGPDAHRVLMVSLEMDRLAIGARILSQAAQVSATAIRKYDLQEHEWTRIDRIVPRLAELPVSICDDATSIGQIVRLVKAVAKAERPLRLLIVDYLQLVQGPASITDRRLEVRHVSATLKRIAKRYAMTVLALSSMTPGPGEKGKPGRPTMRHLRETSDIDHDADVILLLWKPDPEKHERELIIDKGRSGETGSCRLAFTPWYLSFQEEPA